MKILVLSDTHHDIERAKAICRKHRKVDMVVHLGDYLEDAEELSKHVSAKFLSVAGNMDRGKKPLRKIIKTEYGKLLAVHGHRYSAKSTFDRLLYRAEELGCKAVLFGHTHRPVSTEVEGIHLVNPGSISKPRGGEVDSEGKFIGSYAIVTTGPDEFHCAIVYDREPENGISGAVHKIRNMLNYSDRF